MSEGNWECLDYDPATGFSKWMDYDPDTDNVLISYRQEETAKNAIIDRNKASQNEDFDKRDDMWHAAHIPTMVLYEWITKHGVDFWNPAHKDGVKRLLNDPEYRYLRVNHFIM